MSKFDEAVLSSRKYIKYLAIDNPIVDESVAIEWIREYKNNPTVELKEKIFKQYLRFLVKRAKYFTSTYQSSVYSFTDIFQEGYIGFEIALDHFDPDKEFSFLSYAGFWIDRYMRHYVTLNYFDYHLPTHLAFKLRQIVAHRALKETLGEIVTVNDIMTNFKLSKNQSELLLELSNHTTMHLDECVPEFEGDEIDFKNIVLRTDGDYSELLAKIDRHDKLLKLIDSIITKERENDMVKMKFGFKPYDAEYTMAEIGRKYGLSRERVRQIVNACTDKLKKELIDYKEDYDY